VGGKPVVAAMFSGSSFGLCRHFFVYSAACAAQSIEDWDFEEEKFLD
jgi:hypothetical protein